MLRGVYSSASAMDVASKQHEVIANNLANANVPGFRKSMLAVQTHIPGQTDPSSDTSKYVNGGEPSRTVVDFSMGALKQTKRNLDFAINGDGFFKVETAQGLRYTRAGSFHLDNEGNLTTAIGEPVIGEGGPLQLPPGVSASELHVTTDGTLWANGTEVGNFGIVKFEDNEKLIHTGSTQFKAPSNLTPVPTDSVVVQGTVEQSNASIVHEMVQMIVGMRQFEAAQQNLKSISEVIQQYTTYDR